MLLVVAILLAVFWLPAPWGLVGVAAAAVFEVAEAAFWIWLSRRRRAAVGAEALPGAVGVAITRCAPVGQVRVAGEIWRAECAEGAEPGDRVVVERLEGELTLRVRREPAKT